MWWRAVVSGGLGLGLAAAGVSATPPHGVAAFPGCEGWGCVTGGGRGGRVYVVTSTADAGPGTLREALEASGPRTIVAGVDGVVRLERFVRAGSGPITINFLRPPGGGLTVTGFALVFQDTADVVVLGLRYRGTAKLPLHHEQTPADCLNFTSVQRVVVARSSFFGCVDEAVSLERAAPGAGLNSDVTIQQNLFLEGCMVDCQEGRGHARPINVSRGWERVAIHHNAIFGNEQRSPQLAGCAGREVCDPSWPAAPVGYVGYNLVAHWLDWGTHVKNGARADIVGNLYVPGPEARRPPIDVPDEERLGTTLFLSGNLECPGARAAACGPARASTEQASLAVVPQTGLDVSATPSESLRTEAWIRTLGPPQWDEEDERVLAQFFDGSLRVGDDYVPGLYVAPEPWPGTPRPDKDADGIPDDVDPEPDVPSAWHDSNADGWSDLEAWLFGLPLR